MKHHVNCTHSVLYNVDMNANHKKPEDFWMQCEGCDLVMSQQWFEDARKHKEVLAKQEYHENLERHLNHPFYAEVEQYRDEIRLGQIRKGAEKYPEPFTPNSWAVEALADHAMEENYDQSVYITGLRDRARKLLKRVEELEAENKRLREGRNATLVFNPMIVVENGADPLELFKAVGEQLKKEMEGKGV